MWGEPANEKHWPPPDRRVGTTNTAHQPPDPRLPPTVLLFDLGGVLVENATFDELAKLFPAMTDAEALKERWLRSPAVATYERGETSEAVFASSFATEWALDEAKETFLQRFVGWPRGPYPGAVELLAGLRGRCTTAILSNCNGTHWPAMAPLTDIVDHAFSSHLMRIGKPDPAAFAHVCAAIGCAPGDVLFFDDSPTNVRAAQATGMAAEQVEGFDALLEGLARRGLV